MAFTTADLTAIDAAIKSGALSVSYNNRTINYRSVAELLQARETILADIQTAAGTRRSRTFRLQQSGRGL